MSLNHESGLAQRLNAVERELNVTVQELADTYEELSAIHRFSETLGAEIHTEVLCEKIVHEVRDTLDVAHVSIMLIEPETGELAVTACSGSGNGADTAKPFRLKQGQGIPWHVIETRKPLIVCDVTSHPEHVALPHTRTSIMAAPLAVKGKTVGVICASDKLDGGDFFSNDLKLLTTIASQSAIALENARLYKNLENLFVSIVRSFAAALDAKSAWTAGHSERVTKYAVAVSRELGMDASFMEDIRTCGLLHDVGKIGISETILDKKGAIDEQEYDIIRLHTLKGAQILEHITTFEDILPGIKHHHERWDGAGSPDGLEGEAIPLIARILAVADSYDAITSNRPYRERRDKAEAVAEIRRCSGTQFDPAVVGAFLRSVEKQSI